MKTRKRLIKKTLLVAVLTLLLAGLACLPYMQSYADVTINVDADIKNSLPSSTEFTFELYKVGDYGHDTNGKAIFNLYDQYSNAGVDHEVLNKLADADSYDRGETSVEDWTQDWLDTANTLATFINGMSSGEHDVQSVTATFDEDGKASFPITVKNGNGLYLLVGKSVDINGRLWTPQPMFVSVLDYDKTIYYNNSLGLKMSSREDVFTHNIFKIWGKEDDEDEGEDASEGEDISEYVKPDKVAVKVMYGSTYVWTEILEKENGYTLSWEHKPHYESGADAASPDDDKIVSIDYISDSKTLNFTPAEGDAGWSVVEIRDADDMPEDDKIPEAYADKYAAAKEQIPLLSYYTTSYGIQPVSDEAETLSITNTLAYKSLELTKFIDGYDADGQNVTFSFLVEGRKNATDVDPFYTNHIGVTFNIKDGLSKTARLDYIPYDVTDIRIIEEYSGNYVMDGEPEIKFDKENNTWTIKVNNKHDDHGPGGGVVNRYDHDKEKPYQPYKPESGSDDNN